MNLSRHALYETFHEQARWTSEIIQRGFSTRLGILEETITDMNLIAIAQRHSDYVVTRKFSRKEEGSQSGADWLWCIGEPGAWFSLLVQAKVIHPHTSICRFLDYRSGEQRRLLTQFARHYRLFPVYCLYSCIPDGTYPDAKLLPSLAYIEASEWSCALIAPKYVRLLVERDQKKQFELLRYGIPWSHPFYCAAKADDQVLAVELARALEQTRDDLETRDGRRSKRRANSTDTSSSTDNYVLSTERIQWENPNPSLLVTPDLPRIVLRLLQGKIPATQAPIAGVSIVSPIPIRPILKQRGALPEPVDADLLLPSPTDEDPHQPVKRRSRLSE